MSRTVLGEADLGKSEPIQTVSPDLLMKAFHKVNDDHEAGLPADPTVSIVSALHSECEPDELIAISHRLMALANLVAEQKGGAWTIAVDGEEYTLVSEALLEAAATAPLEADNDKPVGEIRFNPKAILEVALQVADPSGNA